MLRAFRWLTQDCYSRAGHFYFPTVSEPKLAPGTKAENSCFLWTAGRSHDFPRRWGRPHEGSLGPVLRQEVTRMKKNNLSWRRDGVKQKGFHAQFKELKSEKICRFKGLLIYIWTDLSNYIHSYQCYTYSSFTDSQAHTLPFDFHVCGDQFPYISGWCSRETSSFSITWISSS